MTYRRSLHVLRRLGLWLKGEISGIGIFKECFAKSRKGKGKNRAVLKSRDWIAAKKERKRKQGK